MNPASSTGPVLWSTDARGVASVVLNRPEVNNAYDGDLIDALLAAMDALAKADGLRAILVKGNGRHFQAGADLKWIDAVRKASPEENIRVSRATAEAVQRLNLAPVPTVGLVHGGCFGGGTGIVAQLLENGPDAIAETKRLAMRSAAANLDDAAFDSLVESHAAKRQTPEAAEGLASFAQKRTARWKPSDAPESDP